MSKKKKIALIITIVILTNLATFGVTNMLTIKGKDKVVITSSEYDNLIASQEKYAKIVNVEEYIKNNFLREVDDEQLIDGQLKGLFLGLDDPYSMYMNEEEFTDFTEQTSGVYGGIGVIVTPGEDNLITVVSPIEGTPGERAGLKTGDKIIKVGGEEFMADSMDKAVKVMKGEPDTEVTLTILRKNKDGKNEYIDIDIMREKIRLVTVSSEVFEEDIGYINLTSFDEMTYDEFKDHLDSLTDQNVSGLVLDLRNNPGGLLNICVEITDELLDEGVIVYTERKDGERTYENSKKNHVDIPLVLLVNEGSASASEILAGAIKDRDRGTIIGETTFGKGIVQRIKLLSDGSGFKLTESEYFTPDGINIHGIGIKPDIEVELPEGIEEIGPGNLKEDTQLQRAIEEIKQIISESK